MKKIGRFALGGVLSLLGVCTLAACSEETNAAEEVLSKILIQEDGEDVSNDFYIPKTVTVAGTAHEITWTSNNDQVLTFAAATDKTKYIADVKRAFDADTDIKFTASANVEGKTASAEFSVKVKGISHDAAFAAAVSALPLETTYKEAATVALPASTAEFGALENDFKETINFAYSLGDKTYKSTTLENNTLTMDPAKGKDKVVLSVTTSVGDKTASKDVKINVSQDIEYMTVKEALAVAKGTLVYIKGTVKSIANEKYGNLTIQDEDGTEMYVYGTYQGTIEASYTDGVWNKTATSFDKIEDKPTVGDYIYLYGQRDTYNGTEQVKNTLLMDYPFGTIEEALAAEQNTMITVYGTVKSIVNDTYGNIYIEDAAGKEFYLYGLYKGAIEECYDGTTWLKNATRYDAWTAEEKLNVGDMIAVYGLRTSYKDTQQLGNGLLQAVLKRADVTPEPEPDPEPEAPAFTKLDNPTASALKGKKAGDAFSCAAAKVVFMNLSDAVVICSTAAGSFAVEIASGKEDQLPTGYAVGDTVSVSGTIGAATKKALSTGLVVAIGATVTKIADAEIAAPTFTSIDWEKDGYNWLCSLEKDSMVGAYVEFTNVTFQEKPEYGYSSATGTGYTKFVTPLGVEEYAGLYHCNPFLDGTETVINTTDKYTLKCYVITPSTHKTDGASTKVRIYAVSIVKQA